MLRKLLASVLVALAVVLAASAWAIDIATPGDPVETDATYYAPFTTGVLQPLGVDTSKVVVSLPEILFHPGASGAPTWRVILGVRTLTGQADSVSVASWHGLDAGRPLMFRSVGLADTAAATVYPGTPKAFDYTLYPLSTYRELTIYMVAVDSTASSFMLDVNVVKGQ